MVADEAFCVNSLPISYSPRPQEHPRAEPGSRACHKESRWDTSHSSHSPPLVHMSPSRDPHSVPRSWCISLANRKAQSGVTDGIFHHRIVAPQGVGVFGEWGPSNLGERQGLSSCHSFLHLSPPPLASDPQTSPQCSLQPPCPLSPLDFRVCPPGHLSPYLTFCFLTKKLCPLELSWSPCWLRILFQLGNKAPLPWGSGKWEQDPEQWSCGGSRMANQSHSGEGIRESPGCGPWGELTFAEA